MCHWPYVQAVDGALETLSQLAKNNTIFVATNAADSSEPEIKAAFERVGLAQYINGYFCKANLGIGKGSPDFFHAIIQYLHVNPRSVIMVGDSYDNDIAPAIKAGIGAIWLTSKVIDPELNDEVIQISNLRDIYK